MSIKNLIAVSALFSFGLIAAACGGGATNTTVNVNAKPGDNKPAATTPAATGTPVASSTTAPKTDEKKDEVAAADSVGVPECDEYIKKYEVCLTKISASAPQALPGLKAGFEAQRNGFKSAASTPAGKSALAGVCKTAISSAKAATSAYACDW